LNNNKSSPLYTPIKILHFSLTYHNSHSFFLTNMNSYFLIDQWKISSYSMTNLILSLTNKNFSWDLSIPIWPMGIFHISLTSVYSSICYYSNVGPPMIINIISTYLQPLNWHKRFVPKDADLKRVNLTEWKRVSLRFGCSIILYNLI
jgi:hypothetical protein